MKKYFFVIGVLEIVSFVTSFICVLIYTCKGFTSFNVLTKIMMIIILIVLLFTGPALGLLFISHSGLLEDVEVVDRKASKAHGRYTKVSEIKRQDKNISNYICPGDIVEFNEDYNNFKKGVQYKVASCNVIDGKNYAFIYSSDGNGGISKILASLLKKVN